MPSIILAYCLIFSIFSVKTPSSLGKRQQNRVRKDVSSPERWKQGRKKDLPFRAGSYIKV
jgi:hypothetical protein